VIADPKMIAFPLDVGVGYLTVEKLCGLRPAGMVISLATSTL